MVIELISKDDKQFCVQTLSFFLNFYEAGHVFEGETGATGLATIDKKRKARKEKEQVS